jgi:hypothetical protein
MTRGGHPLYTALSYLESSLHYSLHSSRDAIYHHRGHDFLSLAIYYTRSSLDRGLSATRPELDAPFMSDLDKANSTLH